MSSDMNEYDLTPSSSVDFKSEISRQLAKLLPEVLTDGKIDAEKLKELLGDDVSEERERFGLFWPGKKRALRAAQSPTTATLIPHLEKSINWETTKNVFIEGDNLEVLKILQKHYHASVDVIYIDPPYNTGQDFVYPDNFKEGLETYLEWSRQVNEEGRKLSSNSESEGRYHSNWLNMMYPRLKLARNLLAEDGMIFISIDDHEQANLKLMCDQIFGEDNFIAIAPRKTGAGSAATRSEAYLRKLNDYVYLYVRSNKAVLKRKLMGEKSYPFEDTGGKYMLGQFQASGSDATRSARPNMWFPIYVLKDGSLSTSEPKAFEKVLLPGEVNGEEGRWLWSREKFESDKGTLLHFDGKTISRKIYYNPDDDQNVYQVEKAWFEEFRNAEGTKEVDALFGRKKVFDHPKPIGLLKHLINLHPKSNARVLDFFAGSSSTAHATMQLNSEDGGERSFIMVQLPEPLADDAIGRKAGFNNIAEVSRKRIELASLAISGEIEGQLASREHSLDVGFRYYQLSDSNFSKWQATSEVDVNQLEQHMLDLRESAANLSSPEDLITEILLKQGYSLTEQLGNLEVEGLACKTVGQNLVIAYLDENIKPSIKQLRLIIEKRPVRFIILEDAFHGDDELKTNLAQECRSRGVELWTA